ncbi:hypothetical protein LINPERPRIM_LOCUS25427, partial [Linum perenne]
LDQYQLKLKCSCARLAPREIGFRKDDDGDDLYLILSGLPLPHQSSSNTNPRPPAMLGDHTPPAADVVSAPPETGSNRPSASPTANPPPPSFDPSRKTGLGVLLYDLCLNNYLLCSHFCTQNLLLKTQGKRLRDPLNALRRADDSILSSMELVQGS